MVFGDEVNLGLWCDISLSISDIREAIFSYEMWYDQCLSITPVHVMKARVNLGTGYAMSLSILGVRETWDI